MIEVLARPTNNAEQFCGQRQGGKFNRQHKFALVWMRILASTGSTSQLLSFVSMWYNQFYFVKIVKYLVQSRYFKVF